MLEKMQLQIDDLQSRLAYQEDLLESLNNIVIEQANVIHHLQQELEQGQKKLDDFLFSQESSDNQKPPHY